MLTWEAVTIDSRDPSGTGRWWAETLGWDVVSDDDAATEIRSPDGRGVSLSFVPNDDAKVTKNRLHLDLHAEDRTLTVNQLEARGARRVDIGQGHNPECVVLADPEGNEFCLLEPGN